MPISDLIELIEDHVIPLGIKTNDPNAIQIGAFHYRVLGLNPSKLQKTLKENIRGENTTLDILDGQEHGIEEVKEWLNESDIKHSSALMALISKHLGAEITSPLDNHNITKEIALERIELGQIYIAQKKPLPALPNSQMEQLDKQALMENIRDSLKDILKNNGVIESQLQTVKNINHALAFVTWFHAYENGEPKTESDKNFFIATEKALKTYFDAMENTADTKTLDKKIQKIFEDVKNYSISNRENLRAYFDKIGMAINSI